MPRTKGSKNRKTQPTPQVAWRIDESLYVKLEAIALKHNLINHRNGAGDRSALIKLAIRSFELYSREYGDGLTYPRKLTDLLISLEEAIANKDWDSATALETRITEARKYLESWSDRACYSVK
ncbi:MAG TPA: hypothetical protein VK211_23620 [Kamptonema sp.]|nr:hypothetical protein [Kamptonema sp.]